jgi:hypothetical protein
MKLLIIFFLVAGISGLFSQQCRLKISDSEIPLLKEKAEKIRLKAAKGKSSGSDAEEIYRVGNYLLQNDDSLFVKCFESAAQLFKKKYSSEKDAVQKARILFVIGYCYYYTGDFKTAEVYLAKSEKAKHQSNCKYYYLYNCALKNNHTEEAEKWKGLWEVGAM